MSKSARSSKIAKKKLEKSQFWLTLLNSSAGYCLVPVRRFPSPSRSIRFSDVSETNGRGTFSHGSRDLKRFGREEK